VNYFTELKDLIEREHISFNPNENRIITLDGNFTSDELRRIANVIDKIVEESGKEE
jgi:hypothetical protein